MYSYRKQEAVVASLKINLISQYYKGVSKKKEKNPVRSLKIYWQIKHKCYLKATFGGIPL